jgi:hypothetical protein
MRLQRRLDRIDGAGEDVPQEEHEDAGGERREARARVRGQAVHAPDRQAEEDRRPGHGAEDEDVRGAHVRVALQLISRAI